MCSILPGALAQDIPSGFKADRYVRLWERNPFTLMEPAIPDKLPSAFDKLFMASWLKDGGKEVVMVQNSETNEVQKITSLPNQNNLRLVEMHPNPNPQFVEVVISDGKEQGTVKFRFDAQPSQGESPLATAGQPANQIEMPGGQANVSPTNLPGSQNPIASPTPKVSLATMHPRWHPGAVKVHTEGAPGPTSGAKQTQGSNFRPIQQPHS